MVPYAAQCLRPIQGDTVNAVQASCQRKIGRYIIPLIFAAFVINAIDRVNLGFAALQMNAELGMSTRQFGWALSAFFVSYTLFQIPAVYVLRRVGSRVAI